MTIADWKNKSLTWDFSSLSSVSFQTSLSSVSFQTLVIREDFNQRGLGPLLPTKILMSWSFSREPNQLSWMPRKNSTVKSKSRCENRFREYADFP